MKPSAAIAEAARTRLRIDVRGRVQGVGFRPFVHRQAAALGLSGFVMNTPEGVSIEAEGEPGDVAAFADILEHNPPPNAVVAALSARPLVPVGRAERFEIRDSETGGAAAGLTAIPPDLAPCPACLAEVSDTASRRHRSPFPTCTDCGPRFTIVASLPFDRPRTSMRLFPPCAACRAEYDNPSDRRFHAETIACPACGPRLALWAPDNRIEATDDAAMGRTADLLRQGAIVAVKGLGGFQLMVDARNLDAVQRLRARKHRPDKPFAAMFPDIRAVVAACDASQAEADLLTSPERPIVLLARRSDIHPHPVADNVAPGTRLLGAMLPSTPLHDILLADLGFPVVATSGNLSGEPIAIDEHEASLRLHGIADALLTHDRPILRPVDDSVARVVAGRPMLIRRARGYAPAPVATDVPAGILALGGHLKASIALSTPSGTVLSQHIGDLDCAETEDAYDRTVRDILALSGQHPPLVAHDLHPDYASTRYAENLLPLPSVAVQHHVAHISAVIAEHRLALPVLGVAWDGTGYGADGTIWGGEFIRIDADGWTRPAHLAPFRLTGGDAAVREPRRAAIALLHAISGPSWAEMTDLAPVASFTERERKVLAAMLDDGVNAPFTTSAGRLFDAVAALLGLIQTTSFEGQAAAALESVADDIAPLPPYPLALRAPSDDAPLELDWRPAIAAIVEDIRAGVPAPRIASAFHAGLANATAGVAIQLGDKTVALGGGCFQNKRLIEATIAALSAKGCNVFWPQMVPPNDGGLAVGQAWWAGRTSGGTT